MTVQYLVTSSSAAWWHQRMMAVHEAHNTQSSSSSTSLPTHYIRLPSRFEAPQLSWLDSLLEGVRCSSAWGCTTTQNTNKTSVPNWVYNGIHVYTNSALLCTSGCMIEMSFSFYGCSCVKHKHTSQCQSLPVCSRRALCLWCRPNLNSGSLGWSCAPYLFL